MIGIYSHEIRRQRPRYAERQAGKKAALPVQLLELSHSALHLGKLFTDFVDILAFVHHILSSEVPAPSCTLSVMHADM